MLLYGPQRIFWNLIKLRQGYSGQIVTIEDLPERPAVYGDLADDAIDGRVLDRARKDGHQEPLQPSGGCRHAHRPGQECGRRDRHGERQDVVL